MGTTEQISSTIDRLRLSSLFRSGGPLILAYHGIGGAADGLPVSAFEQQLDWIVNSDFEVVALADAVGSVGTAAAKRFLAITFDDGYQDYADLAVPLLVARGLPSINFVPANHIGAYNRWDEAHTPRRDIMDSDALRRLPTDLVEIGVHSANHRPMVGLSPSELHEETAAAKLTVERSSGRPTRFFCYPYGRLCDFDEAGEQSVAAAGFEAACSSHFGRTNKIDQIMSLRRVTIEPDDDIDRFEQKLAGSYDWLTVKMHVDARRERRRADALT